MLEAEIQKLTAAIEALNANLETIVASARAQKSQQDDDAYRAGMQAARDAAPAKSTKVGKRNADPARAPEPAPAPAPAPEPVAEPVAEPAPSISKDNLKSMALAMSRADQYAKSQIYEVLGKYGVKTITALPDDPDALYDVFTGFTKIADRIAKSAE